MNLRITRTSFGVSSNAARSKSGDAVPYLAFCANCGSERLDLIGAGSSGIEIRCYVCTKQTTVQGVVLGEIDFLAVRNRRLTQWLRRPRSAQGKRRRIRVRVRIKTPITNGVARST
jgi:hypothetical protein